jgi:hypothetical protein
MPFWRAFAICESAAELILYFTYFLFARKAGGFQMPLVVLVPLDLNNGVQLG